MQPIPLPHPAVVKHLEGSTYEVTMEPLYPGYGVTLGNAFRRVLLSSMPGAAVTGVKIKFVDHEFSAVPEVTEDVIQIILNLKQLRVRSFSQSPVRLRLHKKGSGAVTAADIEKNDQIEIASPDLVICTLDGKNGEVDMELIVEQGRGYVPIEARETDTTEAGMLAIDAIYSPVRSVYFDVSNVRVGQMTNFDKLVIHIETDGTVTGDEVVTTASEILVDHFKLFQNDSVTPLVSHAEETPIEALVEAVDAEDSLDQLTLSNRARNALAKNSISSISQLKQLSEDEIIDLPGLGDKTAQEIIIALGVESSPEIE